MLWTSPLITIFDWTLGVFLAERFASGKRAFPDSVPLLIAAAGLFVLSTLIRLLSIFSFQFGSVLSALCIERAVWSQRRLSAVEKLLLPLGLCSYSFYLFHQPILEFMVGESNRFITSPAVITMAFGPVFLLLLIGLSWLIYQCLEKPSMRLGKRITRGRREIPVGLPQIGDPADGAVPR